jgi:hypothetical protein
MSVLDEMNGLTNGRSSILRSLGSGQPVSPVARELVDRQSVSNMGEFQKGLRRFGYNAAATSRATLGQFAEPFAPEFADRQFTAAQEIAQSQPANLAPEIDSFRKVDDLRSAVSYASGALGQGLPSVATVIAGSLLGRGAGAAARLSQAGRNAAQVAGGTATMFPMEAGETALTLRNNPEAMANTTPAERLALSAGRGTVSAVMESLVPNAVFTNAIAGTARRIAPGVGSAVGNIGRKAAAGVVGEGATEAAQEFTAQAAENYAVPGTGYDTERMLEAGVQGAITGGVLGGAGGTVQAARSNIDAAAERAVETAGNVDTSDILNRTVERIDAVVRNPEEFGADLANTTLGSLVDAQERAAELGRNIEDQAGPAVASGLDAVAEMRRRLDEGIMSRLTPENVRKYRGLTENIRLLTPVEFEMLRESLDPDSPTEANEAVASVSKLLAERVPRETMTGLKNIADWGKKFTRGVTSVARDNKAAFKDIKRPQIEEFKKFLGDRYPQALDLVINSHDKKTADTVARMMITMRDMNRNRPPLEGKAREKKGAWRAYELLKGFSTDFEQTTGVPLKQVLDDALDWQQNIAPPEAGAGLGDSQFAGISERAENLLLGEGLAETASRDGVTLNTPTSDDAFDALDDAGSDELGTLGEEMRTARGDGSIRNEDNELVNEEDTRTTPFSDLGVVRRSMAADLLNGAPPRKTDPRFTISGVLRSADGSLTPQQIGRLLGGRRTDEIEGEYQQAEIELTPEQIEARITEDGGYRQDFNTINLAAQAGQPQERGGSQENFAPFVDRFQGNNKDLNIQGYRLLSAIAELNSNDDGTRGGIVIERDEVPADLAEELTRAAVKQEIPQDRIEAAIAEWRKGEPIRLTNELDPSSLDEDTVVQRKGKRQITLGDLVGANRGARSVEAQLGLLQELGANPASRIKQLKEGRSNPLRPMAVARAEQVLARSRTFANLSEEQQTERRQRAVRHESRKLMMTANSLNGGLWGYTLQAETAKGAEGVDVRSLKGKALENVMNANAEAYAAELRYRATNSAAKKQAAANREKLVNALLEGETSAEEINDYILSLGPDIPNFFNDAANDSQLDLDGFTPTEEFVVMDWADQLGIEYQDDVGTLLNTLTSFSDDYLMQYEAQREMFGANDGEGTDTADLQFEAARKAEKGETAARQYGMDRQIDANVTRPVTEEFGRVGPIQEVPIDRLAEQRAGARDALTDLLEDDAQSSQPASEPARRWIRDNFDDVVYNRRAEEQLELPLQTGLMTYEGRQYLSIAHAHESYGRPTDGAPGEFSQTRYDEFARRAKAQTKEAPAPVQEVSPEPEPVSDVGADELRDALSKVDTVVDLDEVQATLMTAIQSADLPVSALQEADAIFAERRAELESTALSGYAKRLADGTEFLGPRKRLSQVVKNFADKYLDGEEVRVVEFDPKDPEVQEYFRAYDELPLGRAVPPGSFGPDSPAMILMKRNTSVLAGKRYGQMNTLAHEFGHIVDYVAYRNAPQEVKDSIKQAYQRDIQAAVDVGNMGQALFRAGSVLRYIPQRNVQAELTNPDATLEAGRDSVRAGINERLERGESVYLLSESEYFAEQFAKYVMREPNMFAEEGSTVRAYLDKLIEKISAFYREVIQQMSPTPPEFDAFMEWLGTPAAERPPLPTPQQTGQQFDEQNPPPMEGTTSEPPTATNVPEQTQEQEPPATPPPTEPPSEPPSGGQTPPPNNEARDKFIATVKRILGDRVRVIFDQDLPEGVSLGV